MLQNYFKMGWRSLTKHSFYTVVNIAGLFTGITFIFLLSAYIWQELQVNKRLKNSNRQYILTTVSKDPNIGYELATFGPIAKRLKEEYPTLVTNYYRWDGITSNVSKGDNHFREGLQVGDSTLLQMYGFEMLHGNVATALLQPYSLVITEKKAIKYFGRKDVLNETLTIQSFSGGRHDFKITGILKQPSENSVTHLARDYPNSFFIPTNTLSFFGRTELDSWNNLFVASFVELRPGVTAPDLEGPLRRLVQTHADASLKNIIAVKPVLLTDYYLQKDNGLVRRMLYTLAFAGAFILLMAIVNFINITVSRSSLRLREVGVRKVMGGMRRQLIFQFLVESVLLVLIATAASVCGYVLFKPLFAGIVGKELPPLRLFPTYFVFIPILLALVIGALAGLYPAFILSAAKSVDSLKGKLATVHESKALRKSLIGFQFGLALLVVIAALVVTQQVKYFFGRQLGYDKEYVVAAQVPRNWTPEGVQQMLAVRNQFLSLTEVKDVSLSYEIPDGNNRGQVPVYKLGADSTTARYIQGLTTDDAYLKTYGISMVGGSFFGSTAQDSGRIVINQKAAELLGYRSANDAIGKQVRIPGDQTLFTISGVVADFAFGSMQQTIPPIVFFNVRFAPLYRYLSFKMAPGNAGAAIAAIAQKWKTLLPGSAFEYKFMDDTLQNLYKSEIQLKKAAYTASVLSFVIVLLGVLGLVSQSIQKRTRELGIRKVLGASVASLISLFLKEFVWVLIIACIVACPVAWLVMQGWLNDYAYRVALTTTPFIISIIGLSLVIVMLIAAQTARAAIANPVKSLRTE